MEKLTKIELNFDGHDLENIFLVNTDFNSRGFIVSSPLFEEGQELRLYGQKLNEETSYYNAVLISGNENNILIPNEVLTDDDNSFYIRLKFELLGTNKKLSTETVILSVNSTFQGSKIESDLSELYYELSVKDKMIDDFRLELAGIEENELARESAESVRVANEEERELNEAERISKDSERDSKIEVLGERIGENEEDLEQHKLDYVEEISKKANKQQEDWITPTLINGWVEGNAGTRYLKDEFGFVHLEVSLTNGSGNMFTLPSGYRPIKTVEVWCNSGGNAGMLRVLVNGAVTRHVGSGAYVISNGITFKVEG